MTLRDSIQQIDAKLGFPLTGVVEKARQKRRFQEFERDREKRLERYPESARTRNASEAVAQLNRDGFAILPKAFPVEAIKSVRRELEERLDNGTGLLPVSDDAARKPGDRGAATKFLSPEELARARACSARTNSSVNAPFLHSVFAPSLLTESSDIATEYLHARQRSWVNLAKAIVMRFTSRTLYFHVAE